MNVEQVNNEQYLYSTKQVENLEKAQAEELAAENAEKTQAQKSDKLDLSHEAMKLGPIQAKVAQGFYDQPEVLDVVAAKISREYPPEA